MSILIYKRKNENVIKKNAFIATLEENRRKTPHLKSY